MSRGLWAAQAGCGAKTRPLGVSGLAAVSRCRLYPARRNNAEPEPVCAYEPLIAGGVEWRLVRLQQGPAIPKSAPLVVVLHDNEDAALVGALSLLAIRNVQIVMLDSAENRHWGGWTPTVCLSVPGAMINNCPFPQHSGRPLRKRVLRDWSGQHPVISLHSNALRACIWATAQTVGGRYRCLALKPHQRAYPASAPRGAFCDRHLGCTDPGQPDLHHRSDRRCPALSSKARLIADLRAGGA